MSGRYYLTCPNCRTRLKRTGKKEQERQALDGSWLYIREFECPNCGKLLMYSELRSFFWWGPMTDETDEQVLRDF